MVFPAQTEPVTRILIDVGVYLQTRNGSLQNMQNEIEEFNLKRKAVQNTATWEFEMWRRQTQAQWEVEQQEREVAYRKELEQ